MVYKRMRNLKSRWFEFLGQQGNRKIGNKSSQTHLRVGKSYETGIFPRFFKWKANTKPYLRGKQANYPIPHRFGSVIVVIFVTTI